MTESEALAGGGWRSRLEALRALAKDWRDAAGVLRRATNPLASDATEIAKLEEGAGTLVYCADKLDALLAAWPAAPEPQSETVFDLPSDGVCLITAGQSNVSGNVASLQAPPAAPEGRTPRAMQEICEPCRAGQHFYCQGKCPCQCLPENPAELRRWKEGRP